jgi:CRISPR-associated exonuclease Cas4
MYSESEFIMLSALQHYIFCPRQCALIHIEQVWHENIFTAEGRILHERTDSGEKESRNGTRFRRSLAVCSSRLGLSGIADVVEFHSDGKVFPVEYKRGKPKEDSSDEIQLCAQGMCLEEMLNTRIPEGALFYGKNRRRTNIIFSEELRKKTADTAENVHRMLNSGITPKAVFSDRCRSCSLEDICIPETASGKKSVEKYLKKMLEEKD